MLPDIHALLAWGMLIQEQLGHETRHQAALLVGVFYVRCCSLQDTTRHSTRMPEGLPDAAALILKRR